MTALSIQETRPFMAALLTKETFDRFLLREASVTTFCTWTIDGRWEKTFFGEDSDAAKTYPYAPWSLIRGHFYGLIRGKHTPLALRLVFQCPSDLIENILESAGLSAFAESLYGLYLNIRFEEGRILLTTGSAQKAFPPNIAVDHAWDAAVKTFLTHHDIAYEEM